LIAEGFKPRNLTLVDAPVSGGVKGAVNGTLAVMVSCPKATYERVEPILKNFGKLFYTGDKPGTAQTAKLANNLMAAAALVITSEAVAMGVKGGVDARVLIDIINASSGRNSASEDKFPARCFTAPSISASPPAFPTRTSGFASMKRGHGRSDGLRFVVRQMLALQRQIWPFIDFVDRQSP
jgi:3-hydroxyisobutyrate dehydrogenase-like beta-hydroxyacid dehydrogenase